MTPGHVTPPEVSPISRVSSTRGVAGADSLGPGAGPVAGVVGAGLHRVGPGAHDVRLPEVVGGGVEGLTGCLGLQGGLLGGLQDQKNI